MSPTVCPNCSARLRSSTALPRHLGQIASCRHNARLSARQSAGRRKPQLPTRLPNTSSLLPPHSSQPGVSITNPTAHAGGDPSQATAPTDGTAQPEEPTSGHKYYRYPTVFEVQKAYRDALGLPAHAPFASEAEWEMAEFVIESGLTQGETDRLLKTRMYSHCRSTAPQAYRSFKDRDSFNKVVDSLPGPRAGWSLIEITVMGNVRDAKGEFMKEVLECWVRNPAELVADLMGNPEFAECIHFAPKEEFMDSDEDVRVLSDFVNTDWWKRVDIKKKHPGATIAPVILASDKTQLSTFSGDKQAWPVYLTIGNIDKDVRRKPSRRAVVLLGYLPVTKLHCFHESDRALQGYRVFHYAMRQMLAPLIDAGRTGIWMTCADGYVRHVFPLLAAYIADHPEQCLVCCTKENRCPTCLVERDKRGDLLTSCYRDPDATKAALQDPRSDAFSEAGLRDIPQPFWADLPYANIFNCIVPDLLHQLHKGVFMTHLVKWVSTGCEDELDARFARVPPYPGLRIFSKGISTISQWTGNEYR
ncbi:hypothetical protein K466DRAFT_485132, partial [Polyporus arcularius HHB13444]